ncbi:unnamed protein product [Didymodactylos carnosus]|uniref:Inositol polyphosphate-related phosphatase domain-containing protein n=1 Tax=Didymodactylos carnosus TaxID=1234261 RepID=A0A813PZ65_9BILA|nr:unnamed protein product [Didymodactylos carnosus]CAF1163620.1 unnamed protein product [Didymodactylos carnosus]CAF3541880.1 unnamed protein product [Didymodactylos carnosus]CAF3975305.1 unnamed protein product [Didymodactylos carnosus]
MDQVTAENNNSAEADSVESKDDHSNHPELLYNFKRRGSHSAAPTIGKNISYSLDSHADDDDDDDDDDDGDDIIGNDEVLSPTVAALVDTPFTSRRRSIVNRDGTASEAGDSVRSEPAALKSLAKSFHLLAIANARQRNFLVSSGRQVVDDSVDLDKCFPDQEASVMVVTWNTGEAKNLYEQNPQKQTGLTKEQMIEDMSDIILPTWMDYVADIIVICTQEMSASKNRVDWEILLQEVIGPSHVLFHSIHFGTLSLCIFLRRDLIWFCSELEEDVFKFRTINAVRTKASVAVTFNLFGTSFMIINSHFEAGEDRDGRANRKLNFSNTKLKLNIPHAYIKRSQKNSNLNRPEITSSTSSLNSLTIGVDVTRSSDYVLWAGDMNFRIEEQLQTVMDLIKNNQYTELLLKDEFKTAQNDCYKDFLEGDIQFDPTYKYDLRNTDSYAKHRIPSYTDRIFYRCKQDQQIECTHYKSISKVKHSDHKPVVAHFKVKLKPSFGKRNSTFGKFNRDVYRRGYEQREHHHTLGIGIRDQHRKSVTMSKSSVCVLQ